MPKQRHPSPNKIKKALNGSVCNFNAPGPLGVIADSPDQYLLRRSTEYLAEPNLANVKMAVALLGLYLARQP